MEYMEGMEQINSDVMDKVLSQMNSYDYDKYTAVDVRRALNSETCNVEDFKALLSPAAAPFLEEMAQRAKIETSKHFGNTVYLFTPLYIANYCENYCVYCGFNCYNDINRKKLNADEIEHEMRYKYKLGSDSKETDLWTGHEDLSRVMNSIIANLELCDWSIMQIFNSIHDSQYKEKNWENAIRSKYRLRITQDPLKRAQGISGQQSGYRGASSTL